MPLDTDLDPAVRVDEPDGAMTPAHLGRARSSPASREQTPGQHTIQTVARLTGLTTHVIRAWERRYQAVAPERSATARRLYTDHDVARLKLLHQATRAGHRISTLARLDDEQLGSLLGFNPADADAVGELALTAEVRPFFKDALQAVADLDSQALEKTLHAATMSLGQAATLANLVTPITEHIGAEWRAGRLRICQEHLATAVLRTYLGHQLSEASLDSNGPLVLVSTPARQLHELGALMAAVTAAQGGWHVVYLAPGLPAEEVAFAAVRRQARAVLLGVTYPADDPKLAAELRKLRRLLPGNTPVFVGGQAAGGYQAALDEIGASVIPTLVGLSEALDQLRQGHGVEAGGAAPAA